MKKTIFLSLIMCCSVGLFAQSNDQIQNKNGVDIMPVQGEFGLGVNAVPVLNFVGNLAGFTGNNNALAGNKFLNYFSANTIFGKYMLTDDNAIRAHFRIAQFNFDNTNSIFNDVVNNPDSLVMDGYTSRQSVYNLGVGYEWRRGKTRLKGIYGGEIMYQHRSGVNRSYDYGNTFGNGNPAPTSTTWNTGGGVVSEGALGERIVSSTQASFNGIGVRAFAGVEYYIAPKICLGTEFGWGIMGGFSGESETTTEFWDPTAGDAGTGSIRNNTTTGAKSKSLTLDTDNFGGSLYFMFYF